MTSAFYNQFGIIPKDVQTILTFEREVIDTVGKAEICEREFSHDRRVVGDR